MTAVEDGAGAVAEGDIGRRGIKVLIADDHPLLIAGIRRTLEQNDDIDIVGEAHSGPELMQLVERRRPELVLMDLRMPGVSGSDAIATLRANYPELKLVVLSACDDRPSIDSALNAGANAYIVKSVNTSDIASVIRQASGGAVFHASSSPRPVAESSAPELPTLTERERSILAAVAAGMTTATISKDLWVSEHTVKFHLTNIYRKLGVPNRAGAVRYALEHDLASA